MLSVQVSENPNIFIFKIFSMSVCGKNMEKRFISTHMKIHEEGKVRKGHGSWNITEDIEAHNMKEIADYAVATR